MPLRGFGDTLSNSGERRATRDREGNVHSFLSFFDSVSRRSHPTRHNSFGHGRDVGDSMPLLLKGG